MQNNKTTDTELINAPFVYHTEKYKNVYWDIFTKKAYNISKSETKKFMLFNTKGIVSLLTGFILYYYLNINPVVAIISSGVMHIVSSLIFRFAFLRNLSEIQKFEKPKNQNVVTKITNSMDTKKIMLIVFLAFLMVVLCIINIKNSGYTGMTLYLNYGLCVLALGFAILYGIALINKLKK